MKVISTVGIDLGQESFSGTRCQRTRASCCREAHSKIRGSRLVCQAAALPCGHRILRDLELLGTGIEQTGASGQVDAAALCEGLCPPPEKRPGRCSCDLRGSARRGSLPPGLALCPGRTQG